MIRFDVLTLFPEMLEAVLGSSIIGRARDKGLLELNFINIRDFTKNKHRKVDDTPYSGGGGMLMQPQPIYDAYMSVTGGLSYKPLTIYMSPQGKIFDQKCAVSLAEHEHIVLLCGHYEGVDQRVLDLCFDMEISIGDYVLTGGELPAMVLVDCVARYIDGVLGSSESVSEESFSDGKLEYPQYTRPQVFEGLSVPEVLLSGHHANIEKWRKEQSLIITKKNRPDLIGEE